MDISVIKLYPKIRSLFFDENYSHAQKVGRRACNNPALSDFGRLCNHVAVKAYVYHIVAVSDNMLSVKLICTSDKVNLSDIPKKLRLYVRKAFERSESPCKIIACAKRHIACYGIVKAVNSVYYFIQSTVTAAAEKSEYLIEIVAAHFSGKGYLTVKTGF